jgi:hypothetical protein
MRRFLVNLFATIGELRIAFIGDWIWVSRKMSLGSGKGIRQNTFAVMRHVAINLLKQDRTTKLGVKNKRLKAGWDDDYLEKLLSSA